MKYTIAVLTAIAAFATHPSSGFEPAKRVAQEATFAPEGALECQQTVVGPFKLSIVEGGDEKRNGSKVEVSLFASEFEHSHTSCPSDYHFSDLP